MAHSNPIFNTVEVGNVVKKSEAEGATSGGSEDMLAVQRRIAEAERANGEESGMIRTSFFDTPHSGNSRKFPIWRRIFFPCHKNRNVASEATTKEVVVDFVENDLRLVCSSYPLMHVLLYLQPWVRGCQLILLRDMGS